MNWLKKIFDSPPSECDHRFRESEVRDLNKDPRCIYCNRRLSELPRKPKVSATIKPIEK